MRLISQDGMMDVPYEKVSVEQKGNEIWCGYSTTMSKHCIAKFSQNIQQKIRQATLLKVLEVSLLSIRNVRTKWGSVEIFI